MGVGGEIQGGVVGVVVVVGKGMGVGGGGHRHSCLTHYFLELRFML
jgi:hypothetical protein